MMGYLEKGTNKFTKQDFINRIKEDPSFLAFQAGSELIQIMEDRSTDITAINFLYEKVSSMCKKYHSNKRCRFNDVYNISKSLEDSGLIEKLKQMPDIFRELDKFESSLKKIINNPKASKKKVGDYMQKMVAFCMSLSKFETQTPPQFDPHIPKPPYKFY